MNLKMWLKLEILSFFSLRLNEKMSNSALKISTISAIILCKHG